MDLDGQLPFERPLPHIAVLRDELPRLFQEDSGAEEEEAELRGELTLAEKYGERQTQPRPLPQPGDAFRASSGPAPGQGSSWP